MIGQGEREMISISNEFSLRAKYISALAVRNKIGATFKARCHLLTQLLSAGIR
jgi:hypothetical protein